MSGTAGHPRGLTLDASARALGELIWVKRRCFELWGSWVTVTPEPTVKLMLASIGLRQANGAQMLEIFLPVTRDHDPDRAVAPPEGGWPGLGDAPVLDTSQRLVAVRAALDELVAAADRAGDAMSPVSDGPARRALWLVAQSDRRDLAECAAVDSLEKGL